VDLSYNGDQAQTTDGPALVSGFYRAIGHLTAIENVTGSNFADYLQGDSGHNTLLGLGGNDTLAFSGGSLDILNGGAGTDTAAFSGFGSAVWVDLSYNVEQAQTTDSSTLMSGSYRPIADLSAIENLTGSANSDFLHGDNGANVLNGGLGNDQLVGGL